MTRENIRNGIRIGINKFMSIQVLFRVVLSVLVFFLVWFGAEQASAAQLNLVSQYSSVSPDDFLLMDFFLDTQKEEINAVEGEMNFPPDLIELKEIRDGNSFIPFWVEKPKLVKDKIVFSGIIPGGYQGETGYLFSLVFKPKKEGVGIVAVEQARVLLNDGRGSQTSGSLPIFPFEISSNVPLRQLLITRDDQPPEDFIPQIMKNQTIFDGKWVLVFATKDKGSGIGHYEILETRNKEQATKNSEWIEAGSSYALKDQKLRSFIYVKAVDKNGNEKIVVVEPKYLAKWYEFPLTWIIIILGIIIGYILWKMKRRKLSFI